MRAGALSTFLSPGCRKESRDESQSSDPKDSQDLEKPRRAGASWALQGDCLGSHSANEKSRAGTSSSAQLPAPFDGGEGHCGALRPSLPQQPLSDF